LVKVQDKMKKVKERISKLYSYIIETMNKLILIITLITTLAIAACIVSAKSELFTSQI